MGMILERITFDSNEDHIVMESNTDKTLPNDKNECIALINGYLNTFIHMNVIIPTDIVDTIGAFHIYINIIEQKAVGMCRMISYLSTVQHKQSVIIKSIKYLVDEYSKINILQNQNVDKLIAKCFYYQTKLLNKSIVGEYFGMDEHFANEYLLLFDFKNYPVDVALTKFVLRCRIPGEAQKMNRFVEMFSNKYYKDYICSHHKDDLCTDDVYILTYSLIMVSISSFDRLTKEEFIRNNMLSLTSKAAEQMLHGIYDRMKNVIEWPPISDHNI
eukprot:554883_1